MSVVLCILLLLSACSAVLAQSDNCISAVGQCLNPNRPRRQASYAACQSFISIPQCIAALSNVCQLHESDVTFQQVIPLLRDSCNALAPLTESLSSCQASSECLLRTNIISKLSLADSGDSDSTPDPKQSLNASLWCSYATDTLGCISSTAKECSFADDATKAVQNQLDKAKAVCGPNGGKSSHRSPMTVAVALTWTLAALWILG